MTELKKPTKSKLTTKSKKMDDLLNETQEKSIPKKRVQKRQKDQTDEDEGDISKLIEMYQTNTKKKKDETPFAANETKKKLLDILGQQTESRKSITMCFIKRLLDVVSQLESDYEMLKENEQKLEHLAGVFIKCIKQTSAAQKQNLKSLKDIQAMFKKEVEGLLTRGAIRPDDRPLWFDVYRRFPPITEPKFARPKPEVKPIRQILYPEDVVRAKFHSQGHGLGAVNMLNPAGETHTKKLVQQYEKLKSEGVEDSELIQKSVEATGLERHDREKITTNNPESATSQVLTEANLKNIFKE